MRSKRVLGVTLSLGLGIVAQSRAQAEPSYLPTVAGCTGSLGTPLLEAEDGFYPELDSVFRTRLRTVPFATFAVGVIGLSQDQWGGFALPLDLSLVGMPGCFIGTDVRWQTALTVTAGTATWDIDLPSGPEWIGRSFYQQAIVVDGDAGNPLGAVVSNANEGVIGEINAPLASILFPPSPAYTDQETILVRGTAVDSDGVAEVLVNGQLATSSDGFANWQLRVPLVRGMNTIQVETRDSRGFVNDRAAEEEVESQAEMPSPGGVVIHPSAGYALVTGYTRMLAVDLQTGGRSVLADENIGLGPELRASGLVDMDATRAVFIEGSGSADYPYLVVTMDLASGDRTRISGGSWGSGLPFERPRDLALDGDRVLVLESPGFGGSEAITAVDLVTGARSRLSGLTTGSGPFFEDVIAITMENGRALVLDKGSNGSSRGQVLMSVDLSTGDRSIVSSGALGAKVGLGPLVSGPKDMAAADGKAYILGGAAIVVVDLASGNRSWLPNDDSVDMDEPWRIAVFGSKAYVTNGGSRWVSENIPALISLDINTGKRLQLSDSRRGFGPSLRTTHDVIHAGTRLILDDWQAVDLATGDRTELLDAIPSLPDLSAVYAAAGNLVYSVTYNSIIEEIDLTTGTSRIVTSPSRGTGPLIDYPRAVTLSGSSLIVADKSLHALFEVDMATGDRHVFSDPFNGSGPILEEVTALVVKDGKLFLADRILHAILEVDMTTGDRSIVSDARTGVGSGAWISGPRSLGSYKDQLIALAYPIDLFSVDPSSGDRTVISGSEVGTGPAMMGEVQIAYAGFVDSTAYIWAISEGRNNTAIFAVDLETGERAIVSR